MSMRIETCRVQKTVRFDVPFTPEQDEWIKVSKKSLDRLHNTDPQKDEHSNIQGAEARSVRTTKSGLFLTRSLQRSKRDCAICLCTIEGKAICGPCGHYFDVPCLLDLVRTSTQDESLFPPRCCSRTISVALFESYMDEVLATLYWEKSAEFSTTNRVYCATPTCSRFLGARGGGQHHSYTCTACFTRTCSRCRCEMKRNVLHACRPDTVGRLLLQSKMGRDAGWVRCPGCERIVELQSGCYHVACHCKTQFCYRCTARWKSCACPWYDTHAGRPKDDVSPALDDWEDLGDEKDSLPVSVPQPVLPPLPRHARMRETWIRASYSPGETSTNTMVTPSHRRERASAPAELQTRVLAQEDLLLRGVYAQARRRGRHAEPNSGDGGNGNKDECKVSPNSGSWAPVEAFDGGRLDALDEQIDSLMRVVEHYPCSGARKGRKPANS